MSEIKTKYFTFGQNHIHKVDGFIFDCNIVVKISAKNPRKIMFKIFGDKWSFEYDSIPEMEFFPRGVKEI